MKKNQIIKELRECAFVKGKQKTWISKLDDERLYEIFLALRRGASSRSIAEHVRDAWGTNKGSSVHSMAQGIQKFKQRIKPLLVNDFTPSAKVESDSCIDDDKIDVLEQNQQIADQLRLRIKKMMREEQEQGISYPNLNKDILALNSLEKTNLKEIDWRFKNKDRLFEYYEERQQKEIGDRFDRFVEKAFPTDEDRERMVKGLEHFLDAVEKESVLMSENDDGTFSPVD